LVSSEKFIFSDIVFNTIPYENFKFNNIYLLKALPYSYNNLSVVKEDIEARGGTG
jgi:hypothetical protein